MEETESKKHFANRLLSPKAMGRKHSIPRKGSSDKMLYGGDQEFQWHIHRQPQWCTVDGMKGLALYVELTRNPQRALILEFPFKIVTHYSTPHKQRPKVAGKDIVAAISSALKAGWNPQSRGKTFVFQVADTEQK